MADMLPDDTAERRKLSEVDDPPRLRSAPALDPFGVAERPSPTAFEWQHLPRILRRRRWPALSAFVACLVFAIVHAVTRVPVYQAKVRVLIDPDRANVTGLKDPLDPDHTTDADFQTQFTILQSRSLARSTMESLGIWNRPAPPPPPSPGSFGAVLETGRGVARQIRGSLSHLITTPAAPPPERSQSESAVETAKINRFLAGLRVVPLPGSRLVDVYYESTDRVAAATYANAMVARFIQQNIEFKFTASKEVTDWLSDRLVEQRKALDVSEQQLQQYRERNKIATIGEQTSITVQKLTDLTTAYTKAKTDRIAKEALYNQAKAIERNPAARDAFPPVVSNPVVQQLKGELIGLQRQHAQLAEKYGDRHPSLIKILDAEKAADARLQAETVKVLDSVRQEYLAARAAEDSLADVLEVQKKETLALNRSDVDLAVLQRDAESNRQIYESLLQRVNEFSVTRERRTSNIRVIDPAELPQAAMGSGSQSDLRYGALGGFVLALCVAVLLEWLDSHVRTPEQITEELNLPFLGLVPLVPGVEGTTPLFHMHSPPRFGEAFRTIRTNVRLSIPAGRARTVVVTSPCAGDGKTLVASNLAVALSVADQRVILIDADLRRPRLHEVFGMEQDGGLTNLLIGDAPASKLIRHTSAPRLHLLTCGSLPPNPAELLDSRRFRSLIDQLGQHYDWVIFDSPPVLPVTDAIILANMSSAVILVAAADRTPLQAARTAIEQLGKARAHILGAVLNRVDLDRRAYYYDRYYRRDDEGYYHRAVKSA